MGTLPLPNHPLRSRGAAVERLSLRGGAISFKHRRTSHDAKHAPAARVQRLLAPEDYLRSIFTHESSSSSSRTFASLVRRMSGLSEMIDKLVKRVFWKL